MSKKNYHLSRFDEFSDPTVHKTLMETSKDGSRTPDEFMTNNKIRVIDFDEVKMLYLKKRNMHEGKVKSVDALYMLQDDRVCMVEFKNGDFDRSEIIEKSLCSAMIFCDITNKDISYLRENAVFVLVYNNEVKKVNTRQLLAAKKTHRAKDFFSLFGLEHLYGFCFKEVAEIEKNEFESSIYSKGIIQY